ncbi:MAG: Ig-like domain-containing protein, partial [Holophagales bacterium]|nr:Ig-like domain-containing protein [Holophagales bacterium]
MRKHLYFLIAAVLALLFSFNACSGDGGVRVTGVTLNGATSVYAGATSKLSETVLPENAANKTVSWSSSDNSVATVADGTVCGVKEGYANITVTTEDGGFTAACLVAVSIP